MTKLIVTKREIIEAPDNISIEVNGEPSQEISVKGLDRVEINTLKLNPKNKTILAKIDRIKRGEK